MQIKNIILTSSQQLILLLLLAVGLNINTVFNQYAVDDAVVLTENRLVEQGIKGIPEIISHDIYYGTKQTIDKGLSGGRYRPFAMVVFALEYQFFGANPKVSHLINILLFAFLIGLLYHFLHKYIFKNQNTLAAFITCLLFVVHPIHTEVIANVKSRDELIAFILLIASALSYLRYIEKKQVLFLLASLLSFFIALLTRESAITFLVVIPLLLYYFFNQTLKQSLFRALPFTIVLAGYLALRFSIIGFKTPTVNYIMDDPFLFATGAQAFATKIFILAKYIWLLIFPHPLSSDYSYNQIPYINLFSFQFILSALSLFVLVGFAFINFKRKSLSSFCILYFFVTISIVANFVVEIGAPMGERFLFQPSLAFCMIVATGYVQIVPRFRMLTNIVFITIILLFSIKTITRNRDWKNNETLYLADVVSAPNSVRTNQYALEICILKANAETNAELKKQYFNKAIEYGTKAHELYPDNPITSMELGSAYFGLTDYFKASDLWIQAYQLIPDDPQAKYYVELLSTILYKKGNAFHEQHNFKDAIKCYKRATELNFNNTEAWYNLGGNYFLINDSKNAMQAWQNVLKLQRYHKFDKDEFTKE